MRNHLPQRSPLQPNHLELLGVVTAQTCARLLPTIRFRLEEGKKLDRLNRSSFLPRGKQMPVQRAVWPKRAHVVVRSAGTAFSMRAGNSYSR